MKQVLNIGSINIDYVYQMPAFVRAGETLASNGMQIYLGGKGANQSVALAKAGLKIKHAGNISANDSWILTSLKEYGVNTSLIDAEYKTTGHAIIQINPEGENAIFLHGGANLEFSKEQILSILEGYQSGDVLILQNEINLMPFIIEEAHKIGMTIFLNPAPMTSAVKSWPLDKIDFLVINESEGKALTGESDDQKIMNHLLEAYPKLAVLYTMGSRGSIYADATQQIAQPAQQVKVKDTTAAGDTFIGYFIAGYVAAKSIKESLLLATKASAITVTRDGGSVSIPGIKELKRAE